MDGKAYYAFEADPTPANAVALAIADHVAFAGGRPHWEFVEKLREAERLARMAAAENEAKGNS